MIDCIYIAASALDSRYTRICAASVRYFYPDLPVRVLVGGRVQPGLLRELRDCWGIEEAPYPRGDYGWGFIKLEPLFGPAGETFLMLDSDTVLTGPVVDLWDAAGTPFVVDDDTEPEADVKRLYYDWQRVREVDPQAQPPLFIFNSGQWFGTAGVLRREDFAPWVEWGFPPRLTHPELFMPGDQGVLNYVLNQKARLEGLPVTRSDLMRWPGRSMAGLDSATVRARAAPPLVVHWAGVKNIRQSTMVGADLLEFFETAYYRRVSAGRARRWLDVSWHVYTHARHGIAVRARLTARKYARRLAALTGAA